MATNPSDPGVLADARAFHEALHELLKVIQFLDRDFACCYELSVSQCYALAAVAKEGVVTVNDLAARLYLEKSTASRVAAGLEAKGHVVRKGDERDGRLVRLEVSPGGREILERIHGDLVSRYAELLSDFDPEVRGAMTRLVARLAASFRSCVQATGGKCRVVR